ncbi:MAG: hypothetical protein WKG07_16120 [Hymenobacter sp.]
MRLADAGQNEETATEAEAETPVSQTPAANVRKAPHEARPGENARPNRPRRGCPPRGAQRRLLSTRLARAHGVSVAQAGGLERAGSPQPWCPGSGWLFQAPWPTRTR